MTEFDISLIKNKPAKEDLVELLRDHGERLRKLKAECTGSPWQENEEILELVWKLLALKRFDPELGAVPPEHRGPFTIKIRWRLDPFDQGAPRFQNIFYDRIYLTAQEVVSAIQSYMKKPSTIKKHTEKGGFMKIEMIERHAPTATNEKKRPNTYRALTTNSIIRIPLQFPGPWLAPVGVLEFRVHWPGKPFHVTTPTVYKDQLPELIDSGVNLFSKEFAASNYLNVIVKRAISAGISQMILISVDHQSSLHSVNLAKKYVNTLFAIVGVHPVAASSYPYTQEAEKQLRDLVKSERKWIVGIGECGIDYEKVKDDNLVNVKENQEKWLRAQLEIASEFKLPIFVHQRGGFPECIQILKEFVAKNPESTIVVNCFSGTLEELQGFLGLKKTGIFIVITGLICSDDRGAHLREIVKAIPLDSLLIASDAPHLTPYNMSRPYPRRNEPAFLGHILVCVSECLGIPFSEVAKKTTENSRKAFGIPTVFFDGTLPAGPRDIIFAEFQKDEDTRFKLGPATSKKAKPKKITLTSDQNVYIITDDGKKIGFIVTAKEHTIMQKQEKTKSVKELLELAGVMELQKVEGNTMVVKEGSEDAVFSTVDDQVR